MAIHRDCTLPKKERIAGKRLADSLFEKGRSRSMVAFPVRLVYRVSASADASVRGRVLMSVSKRYFKHAVDRNRVKRQLREAYRHHKDLLPAMENRVADMAFIWIDSSLHSSAAVERSVVSLLRRMGERLCR